MFKIRPDKCITGVPTPAICAMFRVVFAFESGQNIMSLRYFYLANIGICYRLSSGLPICPTHECHALQSCCFCARAVSGYTSGCCLLQKMCAKKVPECVRCDLSLVTGPLNVCPEGRTKLRKSRYKTTCSGIAQQKSHTLYRYGFSITQV